MNEYRVRFVDYGERSIQNYVIVSADGYRIQDGVVEFLVDGVPVLIVSLRNLKFFKKENE